MVVFLETFPLPSFFLCRRTKDDWWLFPAPPAVVAYRRAAGVGGTAAMTIASRRLVGTVVRTSASLGCRVSIRPTVVVVVAVITQEWSGHRRISHCRRDVTRLVLRLRLQTSIKQTFILLN